MTNLFSNFRFADLLDISIIAVVLYFVITWIKRRASRSVVVGIALVVLLYALAHLLNMYLTSVFFQAGLTAALVALVLIFQEDIRTAVERIASWSKFDPKHRLVASSKTIDSFIDAFSSLAHDKIGALVAIKGRESLDRHLNGGIALNGRISTPLLYSIFHPETPGHDGAVIVEGDRIDRFAVRLPLSHNISEIGERGTRHSAALGLAERSDALVVVVSEERGTISIAEEGYLKIVDPGTLRRRLDNFYQHVFPSAEKAPRYQWFSKNAALKATALGLSLALWFMFASRVETVNRTYNVPVAFRNVPSDVVIDEPRPAEVRISLSGLDRAFKFDLSALVITVNADAIQEGQHTIAVTENQINLPPGISVNQITPPTITVRAHRMVTKELPVRVVTKGKLPGTSILGAIKSNPPTLKVLMRETSQGKYQEITTEPLNLAKIRQSTVTKLKLALPPDLRLADESQNSSVRVTIDISERPGSP